MADVGNHPATPQRDVRIEQYESFLRKGVQVKTRNVYRLRDGKLVGTMEGHMVAARGDSVTQRRIEGTRLP